MSFTQKIALNIFTILFILRAEFSFASIKCQDLNDILLNKTNEKRKLHNAPDLTINSTLIESSTIYAEKLSQECTIYHAHGDFGENLFLSRDSSIKLDKADDDFGAIEAFYSEISCYCGYETQCPPCVYGHFTQLIWEASRTQGCGACLYVENSCFVIVCRYFPAGNVGGAFETNVKPPYGTQPPLWEIFQNASIKDCAIAAAILTIFFCIIVFSYRLQFEY